MSVNIFMNGGPDKEVRVISRNDVTWLEVLSFPRPYGRKVTFADLSCKKAVLEYYLVFPLAADVKNPKIQDD